MNYKEIPVRGKNESVTTMKQVNLTLDEVISKVAVQPKHGYAKNTMSFKTACIGENGNIPAYAIDSAHVGGLPLKTSDGFIVRVGNRGLRLLNDDISNIAVAESEASTNEGT